MRSGAIILILAVAALIALGIVAVAITPDPQKRNFEIFNEMVHSPAYQSQSENPNYADGMTQRPAVDGSIARGRLPIEGLETSAVDPVSPWTKSSPDTVVARGKRVYEVFCSPCHGDAGLGDGLVARRGFPPPPSLDAANARGLSDGAIFRIVTRGRANMPSLAAQVRREDRWAAIAYIRSLQSAAAPATSTTGPDSAAATQGER